MIPRFLVLAGLAVALPLGAAAADLPAQLEELRVRRELPAFSVAVIQDGVTEFTWASGSRKAGEDPSVTPASRFHFGSTGKSLTALLVARLVERGDLSFDATLGELLHGHEPPLHPGYASVTVRQLLHHTAGAPGNLMEFLGQERWTEFFRSTEPPAAQREALFAEVFTRPPPFEPGAGWHYSNAGYTLAGILCERATGRPFEELLLAEVPGALGLSSFGFGAPGRADPEAPWGHADVPGQGLAPISPDLPFSDNPPAIAPAGTLHATAEDMARVAALQAGLGAEGFLAEETLATLRAPVVDVPGPGGLRYAMGWLAGRFAGRPDLLFHDGSNQTFYAFMAVDRARRRVVTVVANRGGGPAAEACARALALLLGPTPPDPG